MASKPTVWTWYDLSPEDGCTLVPFAMAAASLTQVARAATRLAHTQHRTASKLLTHGQARKTSGNEVAEAALALPGEILWLDERNNAGWTPATDLSP